MKSDIPAGTCQATIVPDGEQAHCLKNRETQHSETPAAIPAELVSS